MEEEINVINPVTIYNVSSLVYVTSDVTVNEPAEAKAAELTTLLKALLSVGIYDSVESAQKKGVFPGTFILVDDPETEEEEFTIQVVGDYVSEEALREQAEALKKLEAERLAARKKEEAIEAAAPSE
jgi:hypothetical protein